MMKTTETNQPLGLGCNEELGPCSYKCEAWPECGCAPKQPAWLGPLAEPVTLADVLDALNLFNRPKPSEDDGPWEGGHFIRVDHLPAFINIIAAAWFQPEAVKAAERERCKGLVRRYMPAGWSAVYDAIADEGPNDKVSGRASEAGEGRA